MPCRGYRKGAGHLCRARNTGGPCDLHHRHAGELSWAHLVIARAGASTLAELTVAVRPHPHPLPSAMDDTRLLMSVSWWRAAGRRRSTERFTPVELAKQMQKMAMEPGALQMRPPRWSCGRPTPHRYGDLLESIGPHR